MTATTLPNKSAEFLALVARFLPFVLICSAFPSPVIAQTDNRGLQARANPQVAQLPSSAKRWALVVGVDQYSDRQISSLAGAANDARMLAAVLVSNAGFPADQVILLASGQAPERQPTRVNILRRLSNLAAVVPVDGLLVLAYAGHGIERGGQAFLLPSDAQISDDVTFLEDTAVSVVRVKERIRATGVRQVVLFLDACRNDPTGRADMPNRLTGSYTRGFTFDIRNQEVTAFATLYATAVGQRAYEYTEKQQGYFTWAVVEGLKGGAANESGEITLAALVRYIQDTVPKQISIDLGRGKEQRPFAIIEGYKADELVISLAPRKTVAPSTTSLEIDPIPRLTVDPAAVELSFWETIKSSNNPEDFKAYLEQYPKGRFASLARLRAQSIPTTAANPPHQSGPTAGTVSEGAGARPPAGDVVSGDWDASADAQGTAIPFTLKLKLEGDKVTGSSESAQGAVPLTKGMYNGSNLSFTLDSPNGAITMRGTIKDGKIFGEFEFAGQMTGKWEATKKK